MGKIIAFLSKENIKSKVIALCVLICLLNFAIDVYFTQMYGVVDLRSRVIGARVMLSNYDNPYSYQWEPEDGEYYFGVNNFKIGTINSVTVPPSYINFLSIIAPLNYYYIKYIWLIFEYICFIYIAGFFYKNIKETYKKNILLLIAAFMLCMPNWHLHIERGQGYIWYAAILCLAYQLTTIENKYKHILAGITLGFLIYLRQPFIYLLLPFVLAKQWHTLIGVSLGLACSLILTLALGQVELWQQYFSAMNEWTRIFNGKNPFFETWIPTPPPESVEGMTNVHKMAQIGTSQTSIPVLIYKLFHISIFGKKLLFITSLLTLGILFIWRKKIVQANINMLYLMGIILYMLSSCFLPAPRFGYHFVQWIFAFGIIINYFEYFKYTYIKIILLGLLIECVLIYAHIAPKIMIFGELLVFIGLILAVKTVNTSFKNNKVIKNLNTN